MLIEGSPAGFDGVGPSHQNRDVSVTHDGFAATRNAIGGFLFGSNASLNLIVQMVMYAGCMAVTYVVLVHFGTSYLKTWPQDVMGLIDSANRVYLGEIPYRDFHLLYGPLVPALPALGLALGLKGGAIFGFNALAAAGMVLPAASVLSSRRLALPAAVLAFLFLWLLIVVPMGEGRPYDEISWGTYYNRQGWAAFIALLLFYVVPERTWTAGRWIDAGAVAVLTLFNVYTKFSFGAMSLGFLAACLVVSPYQREVAIRAIALLALAAALGEAAFHFHIGYVRNIIEYISKAQGGSTGLQPLVSLLIGNTPIIAAAAAALLAARVAGRRSVFDILFVAGCVIATILIRLSIGDNNTGLLVALIAVPLCLGELARRAERDRGAAAGWRNHLASTGCLVLAVLFIATEAENRLFAFGNYAARVAGLNQRALDVGTLPGAPPTLRGFLIYRDNGPDLFTLTNDGSPSSLALLQSYRMTRSPGESLTAEEYMRTLVEGAALLQAFGAAGRTVFTFDMVNPFPYLMGLPPIERGYPQFWLYGAYSVNKALSPSPDVMLGTVDIVMVPQLPCASAQRENMMMLYGDYLRQHFAPVRTSAHWQLWSRNAAS
jgi:hypothetical protein